MTEPEPTTGELLEFHFECLQGMYFSEYRRTAAGALLFSSDITDPYYNFYAPNIVTDGLEVPPEHLAEFTDRGRAPAVYAAPEVGGTVQVPEGAEVWARDAWLIGDAVRLAERTAGPGKSELSLVGIDRRDEYVATFATAYSGDAPDDPYGELDPAYRQSLHRSFEVSSGTYEKHYLLASQGGVPLGVACMFVKGGLAGVYGVGTVPGHRRAGIGTAMMAFLAKLAVERGARTMLLQTEAGSPVQRWYEQQGYRHVFTAPYLVATG